MQSKSALRGRKINNFKELWCLVAFWGLEICVSSTSFQKKSIGWPQQPPTERLSDISWKLDFWWSIPQKINSIGYFGASDDQTIRISFFWGNWGLEAVEASEVAAVAEVNEAGEDSKALKITTEDFKVIQPFEFSFISVSRRQKKFPSRQKKFG